MCDTGLRGSALLTAEPFVRIVKSIFLINMRLTALLLHTCWCTPSGRSACQQCGQVLLTSAQGVLICTLRYSYPSPHKSGSYTMPALLVAWLKVLLTSSCKWSSVNNHAHRILMPFFS